MSPALADPRSEDEAAAYPVARAVRFCFTAVVLALSYPNIAAALWIHRFEQLYVETLGKEEPLPVVTTFVFHAAPFLVTLSIVIPIVAIAINFFGTRVRPIYNYGVLFLLMFLQFSFTWNGLASPFFKIFEKMESPK